MQPQTQHFSIRDCYQSRRVSPRSRHSQGSHGRARCERLELFDDHWNSSLVGVVRDGVDGFYDFAVVCADEEHVVSFSTGSLHLGIYSNLRKSIAGRSAKY